MSALLFLRDNWKPLTILLALIVAYVATYLQGYNAGKGDAETKAQKLLVATVNGEREHCEQTLTHQREIADDLQAKLNTAGKRAADLMQRNCNRTVTVRTATCGTLRAPSGASSAGEAGTSSESVIGAAKLIDDYHLWEEELVKLETFQSECK